MARRLSAFDGGDRSASRRYPWTDWTDGSAWEIRQGLDYDVATENMRVNLHMKADALAIKVRTRKIDDTDGEGLVFQFLDPEGEEMRTVMAQAQPEELNDAMEHLYMDALDIYNRARAEVTIPRKDGSVQKYAAVRFKQQIDKARAAGTLVTTVARIIRKPTLGFDHLEAAGRPDLMLENLVLDTDTSYHRFFTKSTVDTARARMAPLR
jgi:hypothetical protein